MISFHVSRFNAYCQHLESMFSSTKRGFKVDLWWIHLGFTPGNYIGLSL